MPSIQTLPGRVRLIQQQPYLLHVVLYDFGVNQSELTPFHAYWLDRHAKPLRLSGQVWLLHGMASPTGSEALNLKLSQQRADAVLRYLRDMAPGAPLRVAPIWSGETAAREAGLPDGTEDAAWRAVQLIMADGKAMPKPAPKVEVRLVQRKQSTRLLLEGETRYTAGSGEPGARAYQAGLVVARHGSGLGTLESTTASIDETWELAQVTVTEEDQTSSALVARVSITHVMVRYEWKPRSASGGKTYLVDKATKTPKEIDAEWARVWLDEPMKAYQQRKWLPGKRYQ